MPPCDEDSTCTPVISELPPDVLAELRSWDLENLSKEQHDERRLVSAAITKALDVQRYNLLDLLMDKVVRRKGRGLFLFAWVMFLIANISGMVLLVTVTGCSTASSSLPCSSSSSPRQTSPP